MELQIGQKVWVKPSSMYRHKTEPYEATISKIGRKYFELDGFPKERYDIETGKQVNESNYFNFVYTSLQDILDEKEHDRLSYAIKKEFQFYGKLKYSLTQLRDIAKILEIK